MADYRLSKQAAEDIEAIGRYTLDTFGIDQARLYHEGLHTAFSFLAENPQAARERSEIDPPVRAHPYQSHLIVYEIENGGDILILRIPHSRSDWAERIGN